MKALTITIVILLILAIIIMALPRDAKQDIPEEDVNLTEEQTLVQEKHPRDPKTGRFIKKS